MKETTKKPKMTRKAIKQMVIAILILIFIYFLTSGTFSIETSCKDVLSTSKSTQIATGDGWELNMPNKEGLNLYFTYNGKKFPMKYAVVSSVIYVSTNDGIEKYNVTENLINDEHFFFGQNRWYLSSKYENLKIVKIFARITWRENKFAKDNESWIISDSLTEQEKKDDLKWVKNQSESGYFENANY